MNRPPHDKHFRVLAPARAYGVMIAVSGLLLALGLALPLLLASSASSGIGAGHASSGPIKVSGGNVGPTRKPSATTTSSLDSIPETAQGITPTTIKVGVVLLDLSSVAPLGLGLPNYEINVQQAAFDSLFDAINAQGGIEGRKIVPVYKSRDTLATTGPHSDKAICIDLAKDQKVFAVIGFSYGAGECAATEYHLPVVTKDASLQQVYQDSHNLLVTLDPALEREERDWADALVKAGMADGHKLGMVTVADGGSTQLPAEAAADELKALGHPLTVLGELDPSNSIAEIPPLIQKMKSAGVDSVMLASDFADALRFIALAESQHYYPKYLTSDLGALASNGLLANAGRSFDDAIGFTDGVNPLAGEVETAQSRTCRENYNKTTATKDIPAGQDSALDTICSIVAVFKQAATAAGKNLNPRSFIGAVEHAGTMNGISVVLPGSFGPGKTDYSDALQPVRWSSAKKAYSADGDPVIGN